MPLPLECVNPLATDGSLLSQIAAIEGNGKYTQNTHGAAGASGRYQIEEGTAVDEMIRMGMVNTEEQGRELWQQCRASDSPECRGVQDKVATSYSNQIKKSLPENQQTHGNLYLRWNMGITGSNEILQAHNTTGQVTNQVRINKMDNQAWTGQSNPSHGNTEQFLGGMREYMKRRGTDPDSPI